MNEWVRTSGGLYERKITTHIGITVEEIRELRAARIQDEDAYLAKLNEIFNNPLTGMWEEFYDVMQALVPDNITVLDVIAEAGEGE